MATRTITTRLAIEGETEFKRSMSDANSELKTLRSEMSLADAEFKGQANTMDALTKKNELLRRAQEQQTEKVKALEQAVEDAADAYGENDKRTDNYRQQLNRAKKELIDMNEALDDNEKYLDEARKSADKCAKSIDEFGKETDGAQSGIEKFTDVLQNGFSVKGKGGDLLGMLTNLKGALIGGAIVGGLKELGDAIIGVVDDTAEYRKIMGTLETSSKEAGYTTEQTAEAYTRLNGVLGDSQTSATTVANLQAIGLEQGDLMTLIDATTGAWATYGDSIPIDGLSEAINETIQTGKVTGTFADVLNWAGESEDDFNEKLAGANTTSERAQIVLDQLSKQNLPQAGQAWRDANEDIIEYNEAQGELDEAMGRLGEALSPVASAMKGVFADAVNWAADAVSTLLGWIDKAIAAFKKLAGVQEKQKTTITKGQSKTKSKTTSTVRQYANGLDYVPYDGYPAILHEGERVLTRREADDYRSDRGSGKPADIVINLTTTLDGKAVSKAVTRYQQQDQRARQ